jgi:hypothetical protein
MSEEIAPEKTPEVEAVKEPEKVNPTPEVTPSPVADPADSKDDLREIVTGLSSEVERLAGLVAGIVEKADPDSSPVKPPWTERKLF